MNRETRNILIRLSVNEELSPEFREACRVELGDVTMNLESYVVVRARDPVEFLRLRPK
jgi:hypothetical protein